MSAYWLFKSEPDVYSLDSLRLEKSGVGRWDGVRNYQARNFLRAAQVGDQVLFYHSNAAPSGIVGIAEIVRTAYPDPTQFDPASEYYDPKATPDAPRWSAVDVRFVRAFPRLLSLEDLRQVPALDAMPLLKRGTRLSVMPVTPTEWAAILDLAG
jgi:predicted RNA-binding protein with PUA-like domain